MKTGYTMPLSDPRAKLPVVGGKGSSLARMAGAGLPVPDGFYVTTAAYRQFVGTNGLQTRILEILEGLGDDQTAMLEAMSVQIQELFFDGNVPEDVVSAIETAYRDLGRSPMPVAVRSSATAEDLPETSFAGQQESFLNVQGGQMWWWPSSAVGLHFGRQERSTIGHYEVSITMRSNWRWWCKHSSRRMQQAFCSPLIP